MKFSGNLELLKALNTTVELSAGDNINITSGKVSVVHIPHFGDILIDENKLLTELLDEKYSIVDNVIIEANKILLNLGVIEGLQIPTKDSQAANKKYVDSALDYMWEQLQNFNYLSFKGMFNENLTYKLGDLVLSANSTGGYEFYLSLKDVNNSPLTDTTSWAKLSNTLNGDLVTVEQLDKSMQNFQENLNVKFNEQDVKIQTNQTAIGLANDAISTNSNSINNMRIEVKSFSLHDTRSTGRYWTINAKDQSYKLFLQYNQFTNWSALNSLLQDGWVIVSAGVDYLDGTYSFTFANYYITDTEARFYLSTDNQNQHRLTQEMLWLNLRLVRITK